jgi:hypothetical protein
MRVFTDFTIFTDFTVFLGRVGLQYAQYLSRKFWKPLIPIHHMEAHALTPRMAHDIQVPKKVLPAFRVSASDFI